MKILITGAGGLVGTKLASRFQADHKVLSLTRYQLDITAASDVETVLDYERPDIILNCAVIGVDDCEADSEKARKVNVDGPANLARAASSIGAEIVHFSTNYIFDGERKNGFYTIDDEPRPLNVYGRTKWEGEQAVAAECDRSFIVRTSWVFGGGSKGFFDKAVALLRSGVRVSVIADNWASTTFVGDLVERVSEIVDRGHFGTYHVVNNGVCSRYDFVVEAERLIRDSADLSDAVSAADSGRTAIRPPYTPMWCRLSEEIGLTPLREWPLALAEFVSYENSNKERTNSHGC